MKYFFLINNFNRWIFHCYTKWIINIVIAISQINYNEYLFITLFIDVVLLTKNYINGPFSIRICYAASKWILSKTDITVDPCEDFYQV